MCYGASCTMSIGFPVDLVKKNQNTLFRFLFVEQLFFIMTWYESMKAVPWLVDAQKNITCYAKKCCSNTCTNGVQCTCILWFSLMTLKGVNDGVKTV